MDRVTVIMCNIYFFFPIKGNHSMHSVLHADKPCCVTQMFSLYGINHTNYFVEKKMQIGYTHRNKYMPAVISCQHGEMHNS